ncbi:hypothetical protein [Nonomuraea sp. NPDC003709]|uniref:hypothetical protein n=1 Tax=Nonomuraea sp. NPDC003709 TaxID=3154450 RepID=UPI0033BD5CFB
MTTNDGRQTTQAQDIHQDVPIRRRWHLEKVGQPQSGAIAEVLGAIRMLNSTFAPIPSPVAVVKGTDGHLWMVTPHGPGVWEWTHVKGAADQPVGVVAVDDDSRGTRPYIFVLLDRQLQLYWWDGTKWVPTALGTPPGTTLTEGIGAVSLALVPGASAQPFVVVRGQDTNLWAGWWNPTQHRWQWANLRHPEGVGLSGKIGVVAVTDRATGHGLLHVYMNGGDGNLWLCVSDTGETRWTNLEKPPVPSSGTAGVTAVQNADDKAPQVCAFTTAHGQPLYAHVTDAGGTGWHDAGAPPGEQVNLGLGTALVQSRAGGDFFPAALVGDTTAAVWADQADTEGRWSWSRVGDLVRDVFESQLGEGVIIEDSPEITYTHVFLLSRGGVLYDACYG